MVSFDSEDDYAQPTADVAPKFPNSRPLVSAPGQAKQAVSELQSIPLTQSQNFRSLGSSRFSLGQSPLKTYGRRRGGSSRFADSAFVPESDHEGGPSKGREEEEKGKSVEGAKGRARYRRKSLPKDKEVGHIEG